MAVEQREAVLLLSGRVFITGGAGFLARAIYKQAAEEGWPCEFTAFSRDDSKHVALHQRFPHVRTIRGDVAGTDVEILAGYMRGHDYVIHAAANKYVDLAEQNPWETMRVNVHGSENVALAAIRAGVKRVVGISTDKACEPSSTYGLSKAAMERLFLRAFPFAGRTEFVVVRYGNVVGSTGSFIAKLWAERYSTEPVKMTNPEMTRFWMRPREAVKIVVAGLTYEGACNCILVPSLPSLANFQVVEAICPDRAIETVGSRPGEKLHESLISDNEAPMVAKPDGWDYFGIQRDIRTELLGDDQFGWYGLHSYSPWPNPPLTPKKLRRWAAEAAAI